MAFFEYKMATVCNPTPEDDPVTIATLPVRSGICFSVKRGAGGKAWSIAIVMMKGGSRSIEVQDYDVAQVLKVIF